MTAFVSFPFVFWTNEITGRAPENHWQLSTRDRRHKSLNLSKTRREIGRIKFGVFDVGIRQNVFYWHRSAASTCSALPFAIIRWIISLRRTERKAIGRVELGGFGQRIHKKWLPVYYPEAFFHYTQYILNWEFLTINSFESLLEVIKKIFCNGIFCYWNRLSILRLKWMK